MKSPRFLLPRFLHRRFVQRCLAALFGIALIAGLFFLTGTSFASLSAVFVKLTWLAFAGIIGCSLLYTMLGAIKWRYLAGRPPPRAFFYLHYTAQAMLLGQFLPQPIATAASRTAVMKFKQAIPLKTGFTNAVYDLGFDFLIAALLVPVSLCQWLYGFGFDVWLLASLAAVSGVGVLLSLAPQFPFLPQLAPGLIARLVLLSALRFAVVIVRLELGVSALALSIPFTAVAYVTPLATLPSLLPLTPANLGIAEWSWAYLLTLWHVPAAVGALYAVSFRILVLAGQILVSGFCFLLYRIKANPEFTRAKNR